MSVYREPSTACRALSKASDRTLLFLLWESALVLFFVASSMCFQFSVTRVSVSQAVCSGVIVGVASTAAFTKVERHLSLSGLGLHSAQREASASAEHFLRGSDKRVFHSVQDFCHPTIQSLTSSLGSSAVAFNNAGRTVSRLPNCHVIAPAKLAAFSWISAARAAFFRLSSRCFLRSSGLHGFPQRGHCVASPRSSIPRSTRSFC